MSEIVVSENIRLVLRPGDVYVGTLEDALGSDDASVQRAAEEYRDRRDEEDERRRQVADFHRRRRVEEEERQRREVERIERQRQEEAERRRVEEAERRVINLAAAAEWQRVQREEDAERLADKLERDAERLRMREEREVERVRQKIAEREAREQDYQRRVVSALDAWRGLTEYLRTSGVSIRVYATTRTAAVTEAIVYRLTDGQVLRDGEDGYSIFVAPSCGKRWGTRWESSFPTPPSEVEIPEFDCHSGLKDIVRMRIHEGGATAEIDSVEYVQHLLANGFKVGHNAPRKEVDLCHPR